MWLTPDDLAPFADVEAGKAAAMIEDAESSALVVAPGLGLDLPVVQQNAVRAILRRAVLRWHESGAGVTTQDSAGPFSVSTHAEGSRNIFLPSEKAELRAIAGSSGSGAFTIRPHAAVGPVTAGHQPWCSITWGEWCSCGANLTRGEYPLFEGGELS